MAQYMQIQPTQLVLSSDGGSSVAHITWSGWGSPVATGAGTFERDNCTPNCAAGSEIGSPATLTATGLVPYGNGLEAYSSLIIQAGTYIGTYRFVSDMIP
jgi:hypothetical protein